ncbi:hypothetical protein J7E79_07315 [Bacillus sp. ISL-40]|uniref:hypothetical protein n=1 Tax=unclassified Bacillus (in: firmicutes) TaxID=185979 RepID=UPI001BEC4CF4|nr:MULTISPECIES: hypothetical protein [unclassified Bacillus (in: firmicutes)]MBT2697218.1 hypothetical protein [Bacillus sp. ISL-40]MBT2740216.1 hypothetical protein [Bacillus sp. ISL-77]
MPTVTAVKSSSRGYNKVSVSWLPVSGANGYEVYRSTAFAGTYTKLPTISGTSYTNSSLITGRTYYYKIRAYRSVNGTKVYGSFSSTTSIKPVLSSPFAHKATRVSSTSVKLSWSKETEASGNELFRATTKTGTYTKIATLTSGSQVSYTNTRLTKGRTITTKFGPTV